ncbi:hypothetical protein B7494_g3334 [Chlorociboria aeruginascens]|nr:hypothetical protein B7494_g3334 [Chlorociboria aeruginascens]
MSASLEATRPANQKKTFGKSTREVPHHSQKAKKWYPAEDEVQKKKVRKSIRPSTPRSTLTPGTVLILLAGRFRGKRVVLLKHLSQGVLLVTGPFKVNGVPLRRVNARYVIGTSLKIDLAGIDQKKVDEVATDKYFAREKSEKKTGEEAFFKQGEKPEKKTPSSSRAADQKAVDKALISIIKKTPHLTEYLTSTFSLRKGDFPHLMAWRPKPILIRRHVFTPLQPRVCTTTTTPLRLHVMTSTPLNRLSNIRRHFTMNAAELKNFLADSPPSAVTLEIKKHFDALSDTNKRYAHFISRAAFTGARIILRQVSPESEDIYDFIIELYQSSSGDWKALQEKAGITDGELKHFLEYAAQFIGNMGNYKGFGDAKFVPRCDEKAFAALAATSSKAEKHYKATKGGIFSSGNEGIMHLGYLDEGHMTTYYPDSEGITKADISAVGEFLVKKNLLVENTRLRKTADGNFELLIASAVTHVPEEGGDIGKETEFEIESGSLKGQKLKLVYGDHSKEMGIIAEYHRKAAENAANDNQKNMQLAYAKSFEEGSLEAFKNSQRYWIRDKGPMVESNIGFVETYRDPHGVRGEWEGFAATVNLERTKAFGALVSAAESMVPKLPWSKDFEKDKFLSPDFTSLEVLSFASSGIPAGINIPNYDDIRQSEGFKNVSLGNVLGAKAPNEKVPFISEEDLAIYQKYRDPAFEVQVGIHELLGHGTGKLLQETEIGIYNFNPKSPPISPLTNKPITTWYKPGQTWGSVFGSIASSYEECRAECVAMALSCDFEILQIFGFGNGKQDMDGIAGDVLYAAYLSMARAGIASLESWDPKSRKWGQAHSQARFSILKCFLEAGEDFCKLDYKNEDLSDLTIKLDRNKVTTVGRSAVEKYLQKLHIYKTTADVETGSSFYLEMTNVDPVFWGAKVRNEVLRNKQPRKVFVQATTVLDEATGKVDLVEVRNRKFEVSLEKVNGKTNTDTRIFTVKVSIKSRLITVEGPRGKLTKNLNHLAVNFSHPKKDVINIELHHGARKNVATLRTVRTLINNLIIGVTKGFKYKMRYVYAHFPINVNVEKNKETGLFEVEIRNFIGEKIVRKVVMQEGVDVEASKNQKDQLELYGNSLENVSQSAADIQQICRVRNKDIRKFLDGLYVSEKGNIVDE